MTTYLFDSDTFKLVTGTIPWDASTTSGIVELELADGSKALLSLADIRTQPFGYDRSMFRAPYGTVWHQQGDERRLVETITVRGYVLDDANGISDAAIAANQFAQILPQVVQVDSASLSYAVVGLQSYRQRAVPSGYYFEVVFVV
jgi:hypothetical protein